MLFTKYLISSPMYPLGVVNLQPYVTLSRSCRHFEFKTTEMVNICTWLYDWIHRIFPTLEWTLSKRSVFSKPLPNKIPLKTRQNSQGNIQHLSYELQHYMLVIHTCNSHILHRQNMHNMSNYVQMHMVENACK